MHYFYVITTSYIFKSYFYVKDVFYQGFTFDSLMNVSEWIEICDNMYLCLTFGQKGLILKRIHSQALKPEYTLHHT